MPISRKEFGAGQTDLGFILLQILRENRDDAYTAHELTSLFVSKTGRVVTSDEVDEVLEGLVARGRIRVKDLGNQRWYTIAGGWLGFIRER